jgi:hypothetical protein
MDIGRTSSGAAVGTMSDAALAVAIAYLFTSFSLSVDAPEPAG